jgi:hypothetical protein
MIWPRILEGHCEWSYRICVNRQAKGSLDDHSTPTFTSTYIVRIFLSIMVLFWFDQGYDRIDCKCIFSLSISSHHVFAPLCELVHWLTLTRRARARLHRIVGLDPLTTDGLGKSLLCSRRSLVNCAAAIAR